VGGEGAQTRRNSTVDMLPWYSGWTVAAGPVFLRMLLECKLTFVLWDVVSVITWDSHSRVSLSIGSSMGPAPFACPAMDPRCQALCQSDCCSAYRWSQGTNLPILGHLGPMTPLHTHPPAMRCWCLRGSAFCTGTCFSTGRLLHGCRQYA
jgi:hypothetical protein